jgi:hypothetical protein
MGAVGHQHIRIKNKPFPLFITLHTSKVLYSVLLLNKYILPIISADNNLSYIDEPDLEVTR